MSRSEKKRLRRTARIYAARMSPSAVLRVVVGALAPRSPPQDRRFGEMLLAELARRGLLRAIAADFG
jgi:hypothetical protein